MTWEERWHPLREEWVIIAAHRQDRPWIGETFESAGENLPEYVSDCYLCPGNQRVSGLTNPELTQTFVFDNDHPCVASDAPENQASPAETYQSRPSRGIARVVCYSPKHNLTLGEPEPSEIEELADVWREQFQDLQARPEISNVLVFENKGEVGGVSNPHPHCQIYANTFVSKSIETEAKTIQKHLSDTEKNFISGNYRSRTNRRSPNYRRK